MSIQNNRRQFFSFGTRFLIADVIALTFGVPSIATNASDDGFSDSKQEKNAAPIPNAPATVRSAKRTDKPNAERHDYRGGLAVPVQVGTIGSKQMAVLP